MLKVTLDTSVFVEDDATNPLKLPSIRCRDICEKLHRDGVITVAISTRFEADKENDPDADRVAKHFKRLEPYERVSSGFRCDVSFLDCDVFTGSGDEGDIAEELEQLFSSGITSLRRRWHSIFDSDHVWAHWAYKRDYFITSDAQAAKKLRGELFRRFGIKVIHPDEFVDAYDAAILSKDPFDQSLTAELQRVHGAGTR